MKKLIKFRFINIIKILVNLEKFFYINFLIKINSVLSGVQIRCPDSIHGDDRHSLVRCHCGYRNEYHSFLRGIFKQVWKKIIF